MVGLSSFMALRCTIAAQCRGARHRPLRGSERGELWRRGTLVAARMDSMVRATTLCLCVMGAVAAVGCGESAGGDSGIDAGSRIDAMVGGGGLVFEVVASPALPTITADVTVEEVRVA